MSRPEPCRTCHKPNSRPQIPHTPLHTPPTNSTQHQTFTHAPLQRRSHPRNTQRDEGHVTRSLLSLHLSSLPVYPRVCEGE
ncbi:hypothetical protein E2C01_099288 [Portunus trituberculatus]|uniref:Uncharacterized protein n=1 Tax=Portunus trituberculatus TaxID=210409 RepID=A0A5B7K9Z2_PORTR|nr:hypothetical protein [Portunus trituberculatus]